MAPHATYVSIFAVSAEIRFGAVRKVVVIVLLRYSPASAKTPNSAGTSCAMLTPCASASSPTGILFGSRPIESLTCLASLPPRKFAKSFVRLPHAKVSQNATSTNGISSTHHVFSESVLRNSALIRLPITAADLPSTAAAVAAADPAAGPAGSAAAADSRAAGPGTAAAAGHPAA